MQNIILFRYNCPLNRWLLCLWRKRAPLFQSHPMGSQNRGYMANGCTTTDKINVYASVCSQFWHCFQMNGITLISGAQLYVLLHGSYYKRLIVLKWWNHCSISETNKKRSLLIADIWGFLLYFDYSFGFSSNQNISKNNFIPGFANGKYLQYGSNVNTCDYVHCVFHTCRVLHLSIGFMWENLRQSLIVSTHIRGRYMICRTIVYVLRWCCSLSSDWFAEIIISVQYWAVSTQGIEFQFDWRYDIRIQSSKWIFLIELKCAAVMMIPDSDSTRISNVCQEIWMNGNSLECSCCWNLHNDSFLEWTVVRCCWAECILHFTEQFALFSKKLTSLHSIGWKKRNHNYTNRWVYAISFICLLMPMQIKCFKVWEKTRRFN